MKAGVDPGFVFDGYFFEIDGTTWEEMPATRRLVSIQYNSSTNTESQEILIGANSQGNYDLFMMLDAKDGEPIVLREDPESDGDTVVLDPWMTYPSMAFWTDDSFAVTQSLTTLPAPNDEYGIWLANGMYRIPSVE